MPSRKQIRENIRRTAARLNVVRPNLNQTNAELKAWLEVHSITPTNLLQGRARLERSRTLRRRIEAGQFQQIFNDVLNGGKLNKRQSADVYTAMLKDKYTISFNQSTFPVNATNKKFTLHLLENGFIEMDNIDDYGSDKQRLNLVNPVNEVVVTKIVDIPLNFNVDGAFFPRLNAVHDIIDLTRYQIFNKSQPAENCLIHSLIVSGKVSAEKINAVKLAIVIGTYIAKKNLTKISDIIEKTIVISEFSKSDKQIKKYKYGKHPDEINIALYDSHYFIQEKTKYSLFSVKNCHKLHSLYPPGKKNWFDYIKMNQHRTDRKLNSLNLIKTMDSCGYFIHGDMSNAPEAADHIKLRNNIFLGNISNEQRPVEPKKLKNNTSLKYYADCESFVTDGNHKLFMLGFVGELDDEVNILNAANLSEYETQALIFDFMSSVTLKGKASATVYFHNLKYDYALLEKYLNISSVCKKDGQIYSVKCYYKTKQIEFRDSYKLAPMPLSKFCSNFGLPKHMDKMEAINYSYYTKENADDHNVSTKLYAEGLKKDELKIFYENVVSDTFDPITYYKEYLKMDCLVLKYGLSKFNDIIRSIDDRLSIFNSLTISSLTDTYMNINGAYDNVYEQTGNLRDYIASAVYGGRVHANQEYVKQVVEQKIADYDGVSLYPSAINRLCREYGLPTGKCSKINTEEVKQFEDFKDNEYAILSIRISKVNKQQAMPFIAEKTTDALNYSNNVPKDIIHIDSYTLGDYIKFHDIEYEIVQGVVWSEKNKNKKMGELIATLFKKRLENKKSNPALANILKLMLNSSYGKTIMKKSSTQCRIVKNDASKQDPKTKVWTNTPDANFNSFLSKNFNTLKCIRKINSKLYEVDQLAVDTSYNRGHIGCAILSISKRIMNEVFDVANSINAPIYYQDTDSLHMNYDDVPRLENAFRDEYKRELTGANLEQFHIDFDLEKAVTEVYATKSLFLGKKSYIDYLESTDAEGKTINGYHIRLKGITTESIEHHSKEFNNPFEMFEFLAQGNKKVMTLNPFNVDKNHQKVLFEFVKGGVKTRQKFVREIKF